jgi:glycosyltransferase involved in cell wall biosynthesis
MSKIKILAVTPDTYGVGKFRVMDPYKYIGDNYMDDVHVDISYNVENTDKAFEGYNIVVFHSFIHQLSHESNIERIKWLKSKGITTIMDIDDLWFVDQKHPMFHKINREKIGEKKIEMLKLVDYITTTTPIFAKTIEEKLNVKNVLVFPNAIDSNESQFKIKKNPSEKIRFGWLGGSSHLEDIHLLRNGISSLHYSHKDKVQFVLCGFDTRGEIKEYNVDTKETTTRNFKPEETVWYQYEKIFTDEYRVLDSEYVKELKTFVKDSVDRSDKPYVRRWTEDITKYATNYNYFDVSLTPLVESTFNSYKSQLKIIESGFHKNAVISSEVKPYTLDLIDGVNSLLVSPKKNHKQWSQHMKRLADNPELVKDLGEKLYETVKDKYSLQKVSKDRVEFFKTIK